MKWLRATYRGYLWPYLTFVGGVGFGAAAETRSFWHYAEWPVFAVAIVAIAVTHDRVKRGVK